MEMEPLFTTEMQVVGAAEIFEALFWEVGNTLSDPNKPLLGKYPNDYVTFYPKRRTVHKCSSQLYT